MSEEYTSPMSGHTWDLSEDEISVDIYPGDRFEVNPMELVEMGIVWLEEAKKRNWRFLDARGIEILREANLDDFIERLQNVRNKTKD